MKPNKPPKGWKRKMGVFGWDGDELYIPACAAGMGDAEAFLCCSYDGEELCQAEGTVLIRETWARREKPQRTDVFDAIRKRAMEIRASSPTEKGQR